MDEMSGMAFAGEDEARGQSDSASLLFLCKIFEATIDFHLTLL